MYTGTSMFIPAGKKWTYDPLWNPYHNCPAHHQFEVILVSWWLEISEVELTYVDTEKVIFYEYTPPCYFAEDFFKPTTKSPYTVIWLSYDFCLILHYKILLDEWQKMTTVFELKQIDFYTLRFPRNKIPVHVLKEHHTRMYMYTHAKPAQS